MKVLIEYIYSDKIADTFTDFEELFELSQLYEIKSLVQECSQRLCSRISMDNVVEMGEMADKFDIKELSDDCAEFLSKKHCEEKYTCSSDLESVGLC